MTEQWYYIRDRKRVGPIGREQLQQLRASGQLNPTDMVMQAGAQRWQAAGDVVAFPGSPVAAVPAPCAAAEQWFFIQDRKKCGPVDKAYLQLLAATGQLLVSDMVLRAGQARWQYAGDCPDLFPSAELELDDDETEEVDVDWHLQRAAEFKARYDYLRAICEYETLVQFLPDEPEGYQGLAWVWATCPDAQFRNGARAIEYATRAITLAENADADDDVRVALAGTYHETLAAALAEAGDFEAAVAALDEAIADAPKEEQARLRYRRTLFQLKKPFREGGRVLSDTRHEMKKPLP